MTSITLAPSPAPDTFACDCCGAETPTDQGARLDRDARPVCLGCESRHIASDTWAAQTAYAMLLATAREALHGNLAPEDAAAAIAEAVSTMGTVKQRTIADLIHAEHTNARHRKAAR